MYAIIETGGKQYMVEQGSVIFVEKLDVENDASVEFKAVAVGTQNDMIVGEDAAKVVVSGKVLKNGKAKKIIVSTYKPKKGEKRKLGHRQPYTKVEITSIGV